MGVAALNRIASRSGLSRPRTLRGIAAVFLMLAYLFAGALHGLCDLDVTNPSGEAIIAMSTAADMDAAGKGIAAEHHCHGCFSVSIPAPMQASATVEPRVAALPQPRSHDSDLVPGIDTPPPKPLT